MALATNAQHYSPVWVLCLSTGNWMSPTIHSRRISSSKGHQRKLLIRSTQFRFSLMCAFCLDSSIVFCCCCCCRFEWHSPEPSAQKKKWEPEDPTAMLRRCKFVDGETGNQSSSSYFIRQSRVTTLTLTQ